MVLRTPVAQLYNFTEERDAAPASSRSEANEKGPPPLPKADAGAAPMLVSPPSQFPSTRVGLASTGRANRSSVLFLVAIAFVVLTMSAIALAVVVPSSEWSFLRG